MKKTIELLGLLTLLDPGGQDASVPGVGPVARLEPCEPGDVGRRRSLWCPAYDQCLDTALQRKWRSWSCEACTLFPLARPFRKLEAAKACASRPHEPSASEGPRLLGL